MKKVGLCVCQETKNYGSQLQVLATEVAVQKLGYEYEIIRYKKKYDLKFVIKSIPRLFDPLLMKGKISSYFLNKRIKKYTDIYEKCKERNRIFDKFYRADESRQTNNGGAGLGLAITKEIIELHNGKIYAKSNDEFIEFQIELKK